MWKHDFTVPFVCGARDLGEALRRIGEGAAMIRTKGDAGSGNVVEAVRHVRAIMVRRECARNGARRSRLQGDIRRLGTMSAEELAQYARQHSAPLALVRETAARGMLPVPHFAAGGWWR